MSYSPESASELRDLFFETAGELVQALNEDGLNLERNPADAEVARRVRRTVHTLKGDSAAAGFPELSALAHELEDALTAETMAAANASLADLILQAADEFSEMLSAYHRGDRPTAADALRIRIQAIAAGPKCAMPPVATPQPAAAQSSVAAAPIEFKWTEYEQFEMLEAVRRGQSVVNLAIEVEPTCPAAVALQMVRTVLQPAGSILAISRIDAGDRLEAVKAAVASEHDAAWFEHICRIPSVTRGDVARPWCVPEAQPAADVPQEVSLWFAPGGEAPQTAAPSTPTSSIPAPIVHSAVVSAQIAAADEVGPCGDEQPAAGAELPELAAMAEAPAEAPAIESSARHIAHETTLRVDAERIDAALNLVGELIIGKSMLMQSIHDLEKRFAKDPLCAKFADAMAFQSRVLSDLQKSVMKIRMVPVEQLFRRFPRVVRDLAKTCGKEIDLQIAGENTDLDKNILDALAEPLSHIVRNAIDHGLEPSQVRVAQGKPPHGTVRLNAYHQGNHVVISCSDDGHGIDREKLVAKAVASGVITADEAARLNEQEAMALVFCAGISTAEQVTAISGRGVGMDVVKSVMDRLKGTVSIDSQLGKGTTFRLKVPLTLAVINALMFRVSDRLYAVPLASVVEITRARAADVHRVDPHEVLQLRGEVLTLVRLDKLSIRSGPRPEKFFVVVISHADRKYGLVVDSLVGEEEVVIKALDDSLVATDYVSGASILGDGSVVLILNIQALVTRLGRGNDRGNGRDSGFDISSNQLDAQPALEAGA